MLSWHFITSAQYKAASETEKSADKLFFLSDTHEIYRGTVLFTEAYSLYTDTLPAAPAVGRIYIDAASLEGKVYNGTAWKTVIQPVAAAVDKDDTAKPVSGKAVADYVSSAISETSEGAVQALNGASYSATTNKITFTRNSGEDPVEVEITNLPCDLKYNSDTGLLQVADKSGAAIGTGINLALERFVKSAEYDHDTKKITLYFDEAKTDKIEINVADLVDIYTAGEDTSTAHVDVTGNKITAAVKVSAAQGNAVVAKDDGLFVATPEAVDISGKADKVTDATAGDLAKLDANGNLVDAGVKAGGATLAETTDAATLATEKAVDTIRAALQASIDEKLNKLSGATAGTIVVAGADGQVAASTVKAGGAALAATPDATTLATEKAVGDAIAALKVGDKQDKDADAVEGNLAKFAAGGSTVDAGVKVGGAALAATPDATTLATEKAVGDALEWKTTV